MNDLEVAELPKIRCQHEPRVFDSMIVVAFFDVAAFDVVPSEIALSVEVALSADSPTY